MNTAMTVIPTSARTRVGNGALHVEADGRTAWSRRFRELIWTYTDHIGGTPTAPQVALIRRIAAMDVEAERAEGDMAEGRPTDLDLYNRLAGNQRRLLAQLGFQAAKRTAISLEDIIAEHAVVK